MRPRPQKRGTSIETIRNHEMKMSNKHLTQLFIHKTINLYFFYAFLVKFVLGVCCNNTTDSKWCLCYTVFSFLTNRSFL
jgi:hypothetical protein